MRVIIPQTKNNADLQTLLNAHYDFITIKLHERLGTFTERLNNLINTKTGAERACVQYISDNLRSILTGNVITLHNHISEISRRIVNHNLLTCAGKTEPQTLGNEIQRVFNYDQWQRKSKEWLHENIDFKGVCPYCNEFFVYSFKRNNSESTFLLQFDHFFAKSKYPYLALSFFNLVPACSICNAVMKQDKELNLKHYIHPFRESLDDYFKFSVKVNDTSDIINVLNENKRIFLRPSKPAGVSRKKYRRAKKSIKFFHIIKRYEEQHQSYIREYLQKALMFSKTYLDDLAENFKDIFKDSQELKQAVWGNYVLPEDINKRPLAKLTKDIAEEFGILDILRGI